MKDRLIFSLSMRIYAVADIHGKTQNIQALAGVLQKHKPDLVVIAGDITRYFQWKSILDQLDQLGRSGRQTSPLKCTPPIFCIRGNSDFKRMETHLPKTRNLKLLGGLPLYFQGIPFVGANGTIPLPFASRICMEEKGVLKHLLSQMTSDTILVAHPPPRGICDRVGHRFSAGSRNLLTFLKQTQPRMVLCGHIHEQAGMGFVNKTLVVNCAMNQNSWGALIDLEKQGPARVKFLQPGDWNGMEAQPK